MIDTMKLRFKESQFELKENHQFTYSKSEWGVRRYIRNPSANELKAGLYLPRITMTEQPTPFGVTSSLSVEFSAPKLLFGNNFAELTNSDFDAVVDKLYQSLDYLGYPYNANKLLTRKLRVGIQAKTSLCQITLAARSLSTRYAKLT